MTRILAFLILVALAVPCYAQSPAFYVNKNGTNQGVTTGTFIKLTWPNEVFDTNNNFASDKFTPTVAGKYLITTAAYCLAATGGCSVWIYKNGNRVFGGFPGNATTSSGPIPVAAGVLDMNGSTDYVEAYVNTNVSPIDGLVEGTYFTGSLIGGGSGTVNSGTQYQLGYYAANGTAISGASAINTDASNNLIVSSGKIGVGTASPVDGLHVWSSGDSKVGLTRGGTGYSSAIGFASPTVNSTTPSFGTGLVYNTTGFSIHHWDGSATTLDLYVTPTGTIGIGTTSPRGSSQLDVNGKLYVASFASGSATTVCQNGNVLSSCSSSIRFKDKVKPSPLGLKEVLEMKPVVYDLKQHKDNWEKHDFGFVAEDMAKISPLFVTYDQEGRIDGVRYMQLSAVNARAIQELYALVVKQQVDIETLRQAAEAGRAKTSVFVHKTSLAQ